MMACPEGKKEQKFVTAWLGEDGMLRYNSKLPIVVYTPANVDVKYRIWKADANVQKRRRAMMLRCPVTLTGHLNTPTHAALRGSF
ncbi:ecotin [Salmonella enterica subsp. enterica]|uniref:Ecotin n=1 Tax=Salmonella enterica I TaxID=59201 RepID=A0A3S4K910_SALET|nr:ecotin [Salmonella enterica subsp. enterica]